MSVVYCIEVLNLLFSFCFLLFAGLSLRRVGLTVSGLLALVFAASNVVGVSALRIVLETGVLITGNVDLPFSRDGLIRQSLSYWLICLIWCVFLLSRRPTHPSAEKIEARRLWEVPAWFFVLVIAVGAWAPYFIIGPGMELALSTNLLSESFSEAMEGRKMVRESLSTGQGMFSAQVSAMAFFPLVMALISVKGSKGILYWFVWLVCFTCSGLFALSTMQKSPVLFIGIQYVLFAMIAAFPNFWLRIRIKMSYIIVMVALALAGLTSLYQMTEGDGWGESSMKALARVFVTPAASAHLWFSTFPDDIPFRGVGGVLGVASPAAAQGGQVTIRDVALVATGAEHSANASFPAIAWSAFGYTGVVFVTLILLVSLKMIDHLAAPLGRAERFLVFILLIPVLVPLTSGAMLDILLSGVLFTSFFYIIVARGNKAAKLNFMAL